MARTQPPPAVEANENPAICSRCDGYCCRTLPGTYHPGDFGRTRAEVQAALADGLAAGLVTIDRWPGDPRPAGERPGPELSGCRTVRPRALGLFPLGAAPWYGWGRVCVHFTPGRGCALPFDRRPYQCRALTPNPALLLDPVNNLCTERPDSDARALAAAWVPYQDVIAAAVADAERRQPPDESGGAAWPGGLLLWHTGFWSGALDDAPAAGDTDAG